MRQPARYSCGVSDTTGQPHLSPPPTPHKWLSEREQAVWRRLIALQRRLPGALSRQVQRDAGLSGADYEILVNLSESPEGRMRAFEISKATEWEKSRLSHHLTRMEQRGLVERKPCAKDPRYADVVLTPAGRSAIEQAAPLHVSYVRRWVVDALTPDQLDALAEICDAVLARLDDDEGPSCTESNACAIE
jgi:DNA-binding MarR family transcriptional regulator